MVIKILILEHDPNDIELIQYELKKSTLSYINKLVHNEQEYQEALLNYKPDVILSDFNLPNFDGKRAFYAKQLVLPETPFIIVSGLLGEQRAVDLIKMGITDYVLKENLYQIPIKISRALLEVEAHKQKKHAESQLADQNEQIRNILESITDGFFSVTHNSTVNYWNHQAETLLEKSRNEIINKNLWEEFDYQLSDEFYQQFQQVLNTQRAAVFESFFKPLQMWLHVNAYPSKDGVSFFIRNINDIKRTERINQLEREVLGIYSTKGLSTVDALKYLLNGIQDIHPDLFCNVLMVKDGLLFPWAYSHLPDTFLSKMNGIPIEERGIACSTSAFTKLKCAVKDFAGNPIYHRFKEVAIDHNLKSWISYPLKDASQQIMGTFSIFLKTSRDLSLEEEKTIEKAGFIIQHILENHLAELTIQKSEEKYKKLFQLNPLPMWVYDQESLRFLNVNKAAIKHYGYSLQQFMSMSIRDLLTRKADETFEQMLPNISSPTPINGTFEHIKKNGEIIYVASQSNFIYYADKKARLVLVNDITDKIKAKKALELNQMRFKALVQKGSDLINIIDLEGNLTYANPSSARLLGLDAENLIGKNAFEYIHKDDKEVLRRALKQIDRLKGMGSVTFRYRDSEGNYRWLQSTITNLSNEPAVQGILINSNDITERINHINAIEQQNTKLKEIAWFQSHVVRAPLARILGLSNLINESQNDEKEELLRYLNISALELDEVINEIVIRTEEVKKFD